MTYNDLNDRSKQLLEYLGTYDRDAYRAVLWLRKNKSLFKDEIIEPLILHV